MTGQTPFWHGMTVDQLVSRDVTVTLDDGSVRAGTLTTPPLGGSLVIHDGEPALTVFHVRNGQVVPASDIHSVTEALPSRAAGVGAVGERTVLRRLDEAADLLAGGLDERASAVASIAQAEAMLLAVRQLRLQNLISLGVIGYNGFANVVHVAEGAYDPLLVRDELCVPDVRVKIHDDADSSVESLEWD